MQYLIEYSIIVGLIGGVFALLTGIVAVIYDAIKNRK